MTLPIIEEPIYGQITLETTAWTTPFSWVDRTAYLVQGINYSEGGRYGLPGESTVDVGTLNATFKNLSTVPLVGDLVRLRRTGTTEYAFTGYVQDVSQRIVFDSSVSYTTPITLTTINCLDWVGYASQFQAVGAGGDTDTDSEYDWQSRILDLNINVDAVNYTYLIRNLGGFYGYYLGDTDMVGSLTDHLDLVYRSNPGIYWYGTHALPTNKTTGRDGLIVARPTTTAPSSGKTFTDVAGTSGQLHYTEIDFENSSANVANNIVVNNRVRLEIAAPEVTRIGGFNEENFMIVRENKVLGIGVDTTQERSDATSMTTYGVRRAEFDTNGSLYTSPVISWNFLTNPSVEYSDDGWSGSGSAVTRRRKPSQESTPFAAANGLWAMRSRIKTALLAPPIVFSGGESDGIPVVAGTTYYLYTQAARGSTSRTDTRARARIQWYDADEALLSTSYGAQTSITNSSTWYKVETTGVAAPANAVRATVAVEFNRSGGANFTVGDTYWADAFKFSKTTEAYFDGDTILTDSYVYGWTGGVGASPSYRVANVIDNIATSWLSRYSTTSMRVTRIRWNAQEDLTAISSLTVGSTISLVYSGTTTTYRIVGIDGNVNPERYMIDYYLAKV